MTGNAIADALAFKSDLERSFEKAAGFSDRRYYSAVYSLPQQSPVLWINLNPGGTRDKHSILSNDALAAGKHEFFEGDGKTSRLTGAFIRRVFSGDDARLRSIQGTNVVWQRSRKGSDLDIGASAKQTAPFLRQYISYVAPTLLIFGGIASFDRFMTTHEANLLEQRKSLQGNWGIRQARVFVSARIRVPGCGDFDAIAVSHPGRGIREPVVEATKTEVSQFVLPPALGIPDRAQRAFGISARIFVTSVS